MRSCITFLFMLVCVLGLISCSAENSKEIQPGQASIETPEEEGSMLIVLVQFFEFSLAE